MSPHATLSTTCPTTRCHRHGIIPAIELQILNQWRDVAVIVCEDSGAKADPRRVLEVDAGLLVVINASPPERDKNEVRLAWRAAGTVTRRSPMSTSPVARTTHFDGDSVDGAANIPARAP
jgi:NAD+ synthase (glutamine-hydrolysing)